jgi:hypothetical protein
MEENGERGKRGNSCWLNAPLLLGAEGRGAILAGARRARLAVARPEVKEAAGPRRAHA